MKGKIYCRGSQAQLTPVGQQFKALSSESQQQQPCGFGGFSQQSTTVAQLTKGDDSFQPRTQAAKLRFGMWAISTH